MRNGGSASWRSYLDTFCRSNCVKTHRSVPCDFLFSALWLRSCGYPKPVTWHHPDSVVICPPFQGKRGHFPRGPVLGNAGFAGVTRPRILRWGRSGFPGPGPATGDCAGGQGGPGGSGETHFLLLWPPRPGRFVAAALGSRPRARSLLP